MKSSIFIFTGLSSLVVYFLFFTDDGSHSEEIELANSRDVSGKASQRQVNDENVSLAEYRNRARRAIEDFPDLRKQGEEAQRIAAISSVSSLLLEVEEARERLGYGHAFNAHVTNVFRYSSVPIKQLVNLLGEEKHADIKFPGLIGIHAQFGQHTLASLSDLGDISGLFKLEVTGGAGSLNIGDALNTYAFTMSDPDVAYSRMSEVFDMLESHDFQSSSVTVSKVIESIADVGSKQEADALLKIITSGKYTIFNNDGVKSALISSLKGEAAIFALKELEGKPILDDESKWSLLQNSSAYSSASVLSHLEKFPNDPLAKAFLGQQQLKEGELSGIKELLKGSELGEGVIRQRLEGQLWSAENKIVSQASKENPEKVVLEMASQRSNFDSLYLPTALSQWIKQDSEAAAHWVETEGMNLPPETRQYVAIAYAREATSQGNIELAEEWAELIIDEGRKAGVIKEIDAKR